MRLPQDGLIPAHRCVEIILECDFDTAGALKLAHKVRHAWSGRTRADGLPVWERSMLYQLQSVIGGYFHGVPTSRRSQTRFLVKQRGHGNTGIDGTRSGASEEVNRDRQNRR